MLELRARIASRAIEKLKRQKEKEEMEEEIQVLSYSNNLSRPKTSDTDRLTGRIAEIDKKRKDWRKALPKKEDLQAELTKVNSKVKTIKLTHELVRVNNVLSNELTKAKSNRSDADEITATTMDDKETKLTKVELFSLSSSSQASPILSLDTSTDNLDDSYSENLVQVYKENSPLSEHSAEYFDEMKIASEDVEDGEIVDKNSKTKKKKKHKKHKKKIKEEMSELETDKLDLIKEELENVKTKVKQMSNSKSDFSEDSFSADTSSVKRDEIHEEDLNDLRKEVMKLEAGDEVENSECIFTKSKKKHKEKKEKKNKDDIDIDPKVAQKIINRIINNDLGKISDDFRDAVKKEVSSTESQIKTLKKVLKKSKKEDKAKKKKKSKSMERELEKKQADKADFFGNESEANFVSLKAADISEIKERSKSPVAESPENESVKKHKKKKRKRSKSRDGKSLKSKTKKMKIVDEMELDTGSISDMVVDTEVDDSKLEFGEYKLN